MLRALRTLLMTLGLVGFLGQTTARAMPMTMDAGAQSAEQSEPVMMNCADMPGMADMAKAPAPPSPCKGMTADCIGKMGCATTATPLPAALSLAGSVVYAAVRFAETDQKHEGVAAQLPFHPPKALA